MKQLGKTIYINLGVLLLYSLLIRLQSHDKFGILILSAVVISIHVGLTILIGAALLFSKNTRETGNNLLLSAIIVLVVGFGVCWGNAQL